MAVASRIHSVAVAAFGIALGGMGPVSAGEPLALRQIMTDLGRDAQAITDGLSRGEYGLVEKAALRIADHPRPPLSERARLVAFVGADAPRFKKFDGETHDAATDVARAARKGDGQGAIGAFQRLQSTCLACHQVFREPVVGHFYGTPQ